MDLKRRDQRFQPRRAVRDRTGVRVRIRLRWQRQGELDSCAESRVSRRLAAVYLGSYEYTSLNSEPGYIKVGDTLLAASRRGNGN